MKNDDINRVLDLVRELLMIVRDESADDSTSDREVGRILLGLDQMMAKIDGDTKKGKKDHIKMEILTPKKKKGTK
jgi:hypothetical protein